MFSFLQATYSTNKSDFVVQVSLEYGVLDRTVELQLISQSGSAIGIYWISTLMFIDVCHEPPAAPRLAVDLNRTRSK